MATTANNSGIVMKQLIIFCQLGLFHFVTVFSEKQKPFLFSIKGFLKLTLFGFFFVFSPKLNIFQILVQTVESFIVC